MNQRAQTARTEVAHLGPTADLADPQGLVGQAVAVLQQQALLAGQIGSADSVALGQPMSRRRQDEEQIVEEREADDLTRSGNRSQQDQVELALRQQLQEPRRDVSAEKDLELRIVAAELRQNFGQQVRRHRRYDAEPQGGGERAGRAVRELDELLGECQNRPRSRDQGRARGRERHATARPLEEL